MNVRIIFVLRPAASRTFEYRILITDDEMEYFNLAKFSEGFNLLVFILSYK